MQIRFSTIAILGASLLLGGASVIAQVVHDPQIVQGKATFVCTGVSEEGRQDPNLKTYPLKLVFAEPAGAYLADVRVTIRRGNDTVLDAACGSPWMLVNIPAGTYQVTGSLGQVTRSGSVTVQSGRQTELALQFPAAS